MNLNESPNNIKISRELNRTEIIKPWNRVMGVFMLIFSIVWTTISSFIGSGFLETFVSGSFWKDFMFIDFVMLFFGLIPLSFILLGLVLFISALGMLINSSKILLEGNLMTVTHGPLPLMGRKRITKENIRQIYVQELSRSSSDRKRGIIQPGALYNLFFINAQNKSEPLLGKYFMLPFNLCTFNLKEGRETEAMLEDYFGIEDRAVELEEPKNGYKKLEFPEAEKYTESSKNETEWPYHSNEKPAAENSEVMIAYPDSLIVEENMDGLFIFKKWYSPVAFIYLIFGIIWNSIVWTMASFVLPAIFAGNWELVIFALFMLPFIGVGLYVLYSAASFFMNTTTIIVSNDELIVQTKPLPQGKNIRLPLRDISDIEIISEKRTNKGNTYWIHTLKAQMKNGQMTDLIKGSSLISLSEEEVEFLKTKLQRQLQLK